MEKSESLSVEDVADSSEQMAGKSIDYGDIETAIKGEQARRRVLKEKRRPLHYWQERGDDGPPLKEFWCEYCVGFYGVPHEISTNTSTAAHVPGQLCRNLRWRPGGNRQCACIDCVVYEGLIKRQIVIA
jgi:hypothetical protein